MGSRKKNKTFKSVRKRSAKEGESVSGSCGITTSSKKGPSDFGGRRGRMIYSPNRQLAVELIQVANQNGARLAKACQELNISVRTYDRWVADGGVKDDQRPLTKRQARETRDWTPHEQVALNPMKKKEAEVAVNDR